jgi:hypothetical protein
LLAGKFAGENIPEPHPKDSDTFVTKRINKLVEMEFVTALAELGKSESMGAKEQVARVLLAFVEDQSHRGTVISQVKGLLKLATLHLCLPLTTLQ